MRRGSFAPWPRALLVFAALSACVFGCVEDVNLGQFYGQEALAGGGSSETGGGGGWVSVGGVSGVAGQDQAGTGGKPACEIASCLGRIYQCGDCLDNDGDGKVDSEDELCLGPCDNTEDSFYGGIPGQNNSPCRQDCYFDGDTGPGNDDCYWSQKCDPLEVPDDYPPSGDSHCAYDAATLISGTSASCGDLELEQSAACLDYCPPLTPNGCDCFGCCELQAGSGSFVWLGSTTDGLGSCSDTTLDDPNACRPCTPVMSCFNTCDECERCVGRPEPAASCAGESTCGGDYQACGGPDQAACPSGSYCITGCCIVVPK